MFLCQQELMQDRLTFGLRRRRRVAFVLCVTQRPREVFVDNRGYVARVVREHDTVGGHVLRPASGARLLVVVIVFLKTSWTTYNVTNCDSSVCCDN